MGSIPCSSEMISQNCKRPEIDYFMHESFIVLSIIRDAVGLGRAAKFACYDYTITCFQKTIHGALLELREELCFWTQYLLASRKRTILMKRYLDSQANQSLALIVLIAIFQIPVAQNNKAATAIMTRKTFCLQLGYLAPPMLQT